MRVYLIRHAKIQTNESTVQGITDEIILTNTANNDLRNNIIAKINYPTKIYCSNLKRAKQTTSLLFPDRDDVVYTDLLNEYIRPSRFIGKDRNELVQFWDSHKEERYDPFWKPEDGESFAECASRAEEFYKILVKDANSRTDSVAVIGHGTHFRHLACPLTGVIEWKSNPRIVMDLLRKFSWNNLELKEFIL